MNWYIKLQQLEDGKLWDAAIELLQIALKQNPDDKDAYLRTLYLLMNLLLEEEFDETKYDYYEQLAKQYFEESYKKFNHDAEYLFYGGSIACVARWLFGTTTEFAKEMINKAIAMEPDNQVFQWDIMPEPPINPNETTQAYARAIDDPNSPLIRELKSKGSLGYYFIDMMQSWSKDVARNLRTKSNKLEN